MKKISIFILVLVFTVIHLNAKENVIIPITTNQTDLILRTAPNGRLYQAYLGDKLLDESEYNLLSRNKWEVYPASGAEDYFEPAFAIQHNDGNMTSIFTYVSHEAKKIDNNVTQTIIKLKDEVYPVEATLFYETYAKENIIKSWTEIKHTEKKPVTISRYASSMLYFNADKYFLTEFAGEHAKEVNMSTQELQFGKKLLDTKLGSRTGMQVSPFFEVGFDAPAQEMQGKVLMGTLSWTGNFQFTFEVDHFGHLRVISGINPYASNYELKANEIFKTPEFIFTLSNSGTGEGSRNFHDWARNYQLKDGKGDRLTLLNNWEATYFHFDEPKLEVLMKEAAHLGVDMFLLDDGWFGNKYPRAEAHTALGDWEVTKEKLPNGIAHLVKSAKDAGVKFGIWIEPEMISVKSELYEKHPDWAIQQPNRETYFFRNQLVLDLSNPKVQDYVFGVVDNLMKDNPEIAFMKWDCNSPITNIYSPYLKDKQNQLYIDHVRGLYNVLERVKKTYPDLPMMLCSGGGARCDYEALKYFTEFWCSDNTDPIERLFIQWGFSQFFPAKAQDAHVTTWNKTINTKFKVDVAMMGKLGFDINLNDMAKEDQEFCRLAVKHYQQLKPMVLDGDQYRLVSPYDGNHASTMFVTKDKRKAVVFAFDVYPRYDEKLMRVKLQGLDAKRKYKVREINMMPNAKSNFSQNKMVYSGDYLMKIGLNVFTTAKTSSRILEVVAE